ncbi:unnamed protein product [Lactuca virosa]|uniref:Leucine-rich repeat-containing N-terminal plant-type domain-containing protein n=1 Tax=Lactuca virosa TaxID=75947 RepID=A0AAU9M7L7_9ASTR|nr:unnamed protein product [Lactuca virosa]
MDLRFRNDGFLFVLMLTMLGLNGMCIDEDVVGAPMAKTEQEALYIAVQGFVGKWWNGSDLYPDPCGWTPIQGVSCDVIDGLWYVTDLSIGQVHDNSLPCAQNPEFKPHLFQLQHLKSISFFNCIISPPQGPITFQKAKWDALSNTLEFMEFRGNPGLRGEIPTTFGNLKKLQSLVLIGNGLSGDLPESIGELTQLKRLVLSGNSLSGKIPDGYGNLSELLIMDLSRNSLSGSLPLTFGGLTSILKFDFSKNKLEGEIPYQISNLKNLTLFDLSNNNISGELNFANQEMSSLQELILASNSITGDLKNVNWKNLQELMVLDLSDMKLTGGIPESFSNMKNLRFLGLNDNNLSGNLSPKLAELKNLTALYVNGNNLAGDLKFPVEFYRKMGRRFGAWNNSKLCFPVGRMAAGVRPFGVKVCQ